MEPRRRLESLLGIVLLVVLSGLPGRVAAQAPTAPPLPREALEAILRQYILDHPEVLLESLQAFQQRRQAQERARVAGEVQARKAALLEDPTSPVGGNPAGDVTVVEFFDYRCGYCKAVAGALKQLVAEDRAVRVVYKEFPILGPESIEAARAALAARSQGRYMVFHDALMAASAPLARGEILRIAGEVGLDVARLEADMGAPEVTQVLERNHALARTLGITATPTFVVGTEMVPGAIELTRLKDLVTRARTPR